MATVRKNLGNSQRRDSKKTAFLTHVNTRRHTHTHTGKNKESVGM